MHYFSPNATGDYIVTHPMASALLIRGCIRPEAQMPLYTWNVKSNVLSGIIKQRPSEASVVFQDILVTSLFRAVFPNPEVGRLH